MLPFSRIRWGVQGGLQGHCHVLLLYLRAKKNGLTVYLFIYKLTLTQVAWKISSELTIGHEGHKNFGTDHRTNSLTKTMTKKFYVFGLRVVRITVTNLITSVVQRKPNNSGFCLVLFCSVFCLFVTFFRISPFGLPLK